MQFSRRLLNVNAIFKSFFAAMMALTFVLVSACSDESAAPKTVADGDAVSESSNADSGNRTVSVSLDLRLRLDPGISESKIRIQGEDAGLPESRESDQLLRRAQQPVFGDLDQIRERRFLRVLVSYGRTNFFFDQGMPRGFEYDLLMEYEKALNTSVQSLEDRVKLIFIPVPFDQLLEKLIAGHGDIAAAGLTITPQRRSQVDFTEPYLKAVDEVIVGRKNNEPLPSLDDLSGRTVVARMGSSYVTHLERLNQHFAGKGLAPVQIYEAQEKLSTEDILEMLDAGAIDLAIADKHIATIWGALLKQIQIYPELAVHQGGEIAWAVRQGSSQLLASLNQFVAKNRKGSLLGNILFTRYYQKNRWITNPLSEKDRGRLRNMRNLFEIYGQEYSIDWLELVAQAYQESRLDQSTVSSAGAIGVMQLLPSTAADKNVGIDDISTLEDNIHAGAKYMAFLLKHYFDDPKVDPAARMDFAWASYNAGPNRIRRLRSLANERGFDPNRWFGNVEVIAAEKIGRETVDYVRNINKYFVAYKMYFNAQRL
ncbi:MAG: lytic transglycosylase F [Arenicellales bacterium]|nr:lytic transglycosylase F [Arenicellales bacterium]MDP6552660.1 lytic transglycosylase F [Arenicellales bacterium]MDP6791206.1 lytic transglycosylase F [Arenicellales bacterium]MDP6917823.1 lytic transglycosylase F [Arenicellales bacterium]